MEIAPFRVVKIKDKEDRSWAVVRIHEPDSHSIDDCGLIHRETFDILFVDLESSDDEVGSNTGAVNRSVVPG